MDTGYGFNLEIPLLCSLAWPVSLFNTEMSSYQYRISHCGDKAVVSSSYVQNAISYTDENATIHWINPRVVLAFDFFGISSAILEFFLLIFFRVVELALRQSYKFHRGLACQRATYIGLAFFLMHICETRSRLDACLTAPSHHPNQSWIMITKV